MPAFKMRTKKKIIYYIPFTKRFFKIIGHNKPRVYKNWRTLVKKMKKIIKILKPSRMLWEKRDINDN